MTAVFLLPALFDTNSEFSLSSDTSGTSAGRSAGLRASDLDQSRFVFLFSFGRLEEGTSYDVSRAGVALDVGIAKYSIRRVMGWGEMHAGSP